MMLIEVWELPINFVQTVTFMACQKQMCALYMKKKTTATDFICFYELADYKLLSDEKHFSPLENIKRKVLPYPVSRRKFNYFQRKLEK